MSCVMDNVLQEFRNRERTVLQLILDSKIKFDEVGVFGSYSRGDFKSTSDIDFCVITKQRPERRISGSLRQDAEDAGADIVFVSPEYFSNDASNFAAQLRRDYRRLL